jgi:hypothetical protein
MLSPCCLCVYMCIPPINFLLLEPVCMKLGIYVMAPEPISTAHFINSSHPSLCLYVYPTIVARQRFGRKHYRGNEYRRSNRRILDASFSVPSVSCQRKVGKSFFSELIVNSVLRCENLIIGFMIACNISGYQYFGWIHTSIFRVEVIMTLNMEETVSAGDYCPVTRVYKERTDCYERWFVTRTILKGRYFVFPLVTCFIFGPDIPLGTLPSNTIVMSSN